MTGLMLQGEEEIPVQLSFWRSEPMRLNPPKKLTFWISVGLAALSVIVYVFHWVVPLDYIKGIGFLLALAAYILLALGLTLKGL